MSELLRKILSIINVIFFVFTIFWGIDGVIYELVGAEIYEKILAWFRIPWSFEQSLKIAYICIAIWIVTYFLLVKFFGE